MYIYIEVYDDDGLDVTVFGLVDDWQESKVLESIRFANWQEFLASDWYDYEIPLHISPDLFSDAGMDNTEWQTENLYK